MIPEIEKPLPDENEAARIKKIALIRVVDDDAGMLRSYKFMFSSQGWNVKCYSDAASFLEEVTDVPGCLILDVRMPEMSGLTLRREMMKRGIALPILFVTGHGDVDMAVETMQMGACDFMLKPVDPARLRKAVLRWSAFAVQQHLDRLKREAKQADFSTLSTREREVLQLISEGLQYKQIADQLGISERTVKFHRASLCEKLGVKTTQELAVCAVEGFKI